MNFKKLIKILFKPRGFYDRLNHAAIINIHKRSDYQRFLETRLSKDVISESYRVNSITELCVLFFTICNDDTLVIIEDRSKKQVEYTLLTETTLQNTLKTKLYNYLPDNMIVYFSHREHILY